MIRKILIIICILVFCGSGYYILQYVLDNMSAQKTISEVAETKTRGLDEVYRENNDLIGWIEIEGTNINYPVMQTGNGTGEADPQFYLHRDFHKEPSDSGTPFLDSNSMIADATKLDGGQPGTFVASESTWNWLIYGHHMKFGTMFHDLLEFEEKDFWEDHKTFHFDRIRLTTEGVEEIDEDYEIIAAGYSQIYPSDADVFKYYTYAGYYDEDSFNEFVSGVKAESCYDTGVSAVYGDQLVTLSTCAYHVDNGRFYIVGKRMR